MKLCDQRWREALLDHVLGSPASAALAQHLAACPVCTAALQESRTRMVSIDSGIRALAVSEPAPHAVARVMAEVRAQRPRVSFPIWQRTFAAASGLAIVIVALLLVRKAQMPRGETERVLSAASAIAAWRSPTDALLRSPADQWLKVPPRLGDYFYQLNNTTVLEKEREHP